MESSLNCLQYIEISTFLGVYLSQIYMYGSKSHFQLSRINAGNSYPLEIKIHMPVIMRLTEYFFLCIAQ